MTVPLTALESPARIVRRSGSSFLVSFSALERERRRGLTAIYAFCRVIDDAADAGADPAQARADLEFWRAEAGRGDPTTEVGRELAWAVRRFGVEARHLDAVLDGVTSDVGRVDIASSAELEQYCFRVACSVGLACLPVLGAAGEAAARYAIELGHALQLTNILRDLRSDARAGRIYVSRDLRARHGVEDAWLEGRGPPHVYARGGAVDALAADLVGLARARFAVAEACLDDALRARLVPAEIMSTVYRELLRRLEQLGGAICTERRVRVPLWRKLWLARRARKRAHAQA